MARTTNTPGLARWLAIVAAWWVLIPAALAPAESTLFEQPPAAQFSPWPAAVAEVPPDRSPGAFGNQNVPPDRSPGALGGQNLPPPQALPPAVELTPGPTVPPLEEEVPRGVRPGMFQRAILSGTWINPDGISGLGMSDVELKGIFALPCPTREWPLVITPGFATHWIDAPGADLPPRLYDAYAEFRWLPKLAPRLMLDLAVTPGVFRDFDQHTGDGLRVTSHAAAVWTWLPTTKLVLGASYLDRSDLNVIPVGGLIWTPNPDWDFELLFPQPKIARRFHCCGEHAADVEDWFYIAGEFGDWVWAIQHGDGTLDKAEYRDARLLLGIERKVCGGLSGRLEVGYVFARKLRYTSGLPGFEPNDALLLRAGVDY